MVDYATKESEAQEIWQRRPLKSFLFIVDLLFSKMYAECYLSLTEILFDDGMGFECPADNLLDMHGPRIHFGMRNSQTNLRFDLARPVWIHILGECNLKKRQKERKELERQKSIKNLEGSSLAHRLPQPLLRFTVRCESSLITEYKWER